MTGRTTGRCKAHGPQTREERALSGLAEAAGQVDSHITGSIASRSFVRFTLSCNGSLKTSPERVCTCLYKSDISENYKCPILSCPSVSSLLSRRVMSGHVVSSLFVSPLVVSDHVLSPLLVLRACHLFSYHVCHVTFLQPLLMSRRTISCDLCVVEPATPPTTLSTSDARAFRSEEGEGVEVNSPCGMARW